MGSPTSGTSTPGMGHFGTWNPCSPACIPLNTPTPPCGTLNGQTGGNNYSVKFLYATYQGDPSYYNQVIGADNTAGLAEVVDKMNYGLKQSEPSGFQQRIRMHCARTTQPATSASLPPTEKITPVLLSTANYSAPGQNDCPAFSWCSMIRSLQEQGYNKTSKVYFVFMDTARNNGNGVGSQANVCRSTGPCYGVATQDWTAVAAHEFTHTMGAPHTAGGCTDGGFTSTFEGNDVMYSWWAWWKRDDGGNDYYNTYNGFDPSFYCGQHNDTNMGGWNVVRSPFVEFAP